ncbi:MAG: hypothetical protein DMF70_08715 [Acidobacteria bacterium]|nr:MAG: hypothetical protein DMF70_08715 [Acidobacteriota bacterium]
MRAGTRNAFRRERLIRAHRSRAAHGDRRRGPCRRFAGATGGAGWLSRDARELVLAELWSDAIREAIGNGRGVSVAIVTRGHKQDEDCLRAAIATSPDYVGMIGSKRRTNFVLDKLREEGAYEDQLKKVRAPIGLDIGAVSPEEVALAILAEIVGERRGGKGAPLSSWRRS